MRRKKDQSIGKRKRRKETKKKHRRFCQCFQNVAKTKSHLGQVKSRVGGKLRHFVSAGGLSVASCAVSYHANQTKYSVNLQPQDVFQYCYCFVYILNRLLNKQLRQLPRKRNLSETRSYHISINKQRFCEQNNCCLPSLCYFTRNKYYTVSLQK